MLDYRIHTFLTLCKTMNYSTTAELLHITQPAVTQHIQYLEQYYGCRLFLYEHRKLQMTAEAQLLQQYVNSMNYQETKLLEALKAPMGYNLKIGVTKTIGKYVIRRQIANYLQDKDNRISIIIDNTSNILQLLDQGTIDFAIVEGSFDRKKYSCQLYRTESFSGFCSKMHPFAGKTIQMNSLWSQNLLLREEGSGTRSILEHQLLTYNHTISDFTRTTCISDFHLLAHLVEMNCGIMFAYSSVGNDYTGILPFQVEGWQIFREFNYVYLRNTDAEALVSFFHNYS